MRSCYFVNIQPLATSTSKKQQILPHKVTHYIPHLQLSIKKISHHPYIHNSTQPRSHPGNRRRRLPNRNPTLSERSKKGGNHTTQRKCTSQKCTAMTPHSRPLNQSPVTLCPVVALAQHLAVAYIGAAAATPRRHMVGVHLAVA